jgi:hypothetical protein
VTISPSWNGTSTNVPLASGTSLGNNHNAGESLTFTEPGVTKTGTTMLEALTPTSMTVVMHGTGLEGVAFGLLF